MKKDYSLFKQKNLNKKNMEKLKSPDIKGS